jgi:hypothetical protein
VDILALSVLDSAPVLVHRLIRCSDWCGCRLHCNARSEPPGSATQPSSISARYTCHGSPAYRLFCRSWFYTYSHVYPLSFSGAVFHLHVFTDGLSIPFFSAGRHTLTISRSLVDQPDWLLGVRRAPPREDPERAQQRGAPPRKDEPRRHDASVQIVESST